MRRESLIPATAGALRRLARSERGLTVPLVLIVIIVGLGLGGAAVTASIYAQRGSVRDEHSKEALAAADAGVQLAFYRLNKIVTTGALPCVVGGVTSGDLAPGAAASDGWCPAQTAADGSFTYRVKPWSLVSVLHQGTKRQLQIVSVGTSSGVSRRVAVTASARIGTSAFGDAGAIGVDHVTLEGDAKIGSSTIVTNAGTNGDITIRNNGTLCGDGEYGIGHDLIFENNGSQCSGHTEIEQELVLPPVDPSTVWTNNSNGRFFTQDPKRGNVTWDAVTRTLTMTGNATLTLGGSNYSFCSLNMSGSSQLIIAQGAIVNLFFHAPETCGMSPSTGCDSNAATVDQICLTGNPRITTTSENPGDLRLLVVGSDSIPTSVNMTGNSRVTNEFTLYAPRTDVFLSGNAQYVGAIAGKTLTTGGSAEILADDRSLGADLAVTIVYHRDRYVECTGGAMPPPATPPNSSC